MAETEKCLTLEIVTPDGTARRTVCDSVRLTLADGRSGRGGGSLGVRKGHAPAVFLLADGLTTALRDGVVILSVRTGDGFAIVDGDTLSVAVSRVEMPEE